MTDFEYTLLPNPQIQQLSIRDLFKSTFAYSENKEEGETIGILSQNLIEQTSSQDLYIFVATETNDAATGIIGCIMFSRLTFAQQPETTAFVLGPVAVHTAYQRRGIGQSLIRFGIKTLRATNSIDLVVTYGDPKYYSKVGFKQVTTEIIPSPMPLSHPMGWQAQSLRSTNGGTIKAIPGTSSCVSAFNKPEYW